jgi:predicted TIM-barrel fold metal-dependent hydrolase
VSAIQWLHPDAMHLVDTELPAIFVFDEAEIEAEAWTLKRIQFLYETLLELPVEIARGDVAAEVARFAERHQAGRVVVVDSVNPRFAQQVQELRKSLTVEVREPEPFVAYRGTLDLKRFARYWKRVEPILFDK